MKTRGVPYLEGPPGSEPYYGGEGLITSGELSNQGVEQVLNLNPKLTRVAWAVSPTGPVAVKARSRCAALTSPEKIRIKNDSVGTRGSDYIRPCP